MKYTVVATMKFKKSQISKMYKLETYYKYGICGKEFMKKKKYRCHIQSHADFSNVNHHEKKTNVCQTMETALEDTPKDDTISVKLETIYKCRICGEEFWKKKKYKFHSQTHADKPNIEAAHHMEETNEHNQLQGYFVDSNNRVTHKYDPVVQFEGELTSIECINSYKCNQCVASFSTQNKLKLHLLTHLYTRNAQSDNPASKSEEIKFDLNGSEDLCTCRVCTMVFESCEHLANHNCSGKKLFQCTICKKGLSSKRYLRIHSLTHSNRCEYQCDVCLKYYKSKYILKIHRTLHTGEKLFKRNICDRNFLVQSSLIAQIDRHEGKKSHQCNSCLKSFATKVSLKRHESIHTGIRYKCDKCDLQFRINSDMQMHAQTHSGPNPYLCRICNAHFSQRDQLDQHKLMLHQKDNLYKCGKCEAVLKNYTIFKSHSKTHSEERPFKCNKCVSMFKHKADLTKHLLYSKSCGSLFGEHQNSCVKCDICGGSFPTKDKLEIHILIHAEWPYKCDLCLKVFETLPILADHRKNHILFSCDVCLVEFRSHNLLKAHQLEHKPVKAFQCTSCKTVFTTKIDLKCHSKIHNEKVVKPFQCDLCLKGYLLKSSLRRHYPSHFTGPRRYKCNWCGDRFKFFCDLEEHLKNQHAK